MLKVLNVRRKDNLSGWHIQHFFVLLKMIAGSFRASLQAREYIPERRNVRIRIILRMGDASLIGEMSG